MTSPTSPTAKPNKLDQGVYVKKVGETKIWFRGNTVVVDLAYLVNIAIHAKNTSKGEVFKFENHDFLVQLVSCFGQYFSLGLLQNSYHLSFLT